MKYFLAAVLVFPLLLTAQADLLDTTYHDNHEVASISFYTLKLSEDLTKAEAFQRGLVHLKPGDTIYIRDSIHYWDAAGNRLADGAISRPPLFPSRGTRSPDPHRVFIPATYYSGYVGSELYDTLQIGRVPEIGPGERVRIYTASSVIALDTQIVLKHAVESGVPFTIIPDTGSHRVTVTIENLKSGERTSFPVTVEGYDLERADFTSRHPDIPVRTLKLKERSKLLLQLEGAEKLLTVSREGQVVERFSVGRGRDEIPLRSWSAGNYLLQLRDLGTNENLYTLLRLE
ncbi:hypothetical protein [Lewinella sp. IMCC34191]|uniref:hypothetical protein n=1 Tax=Lewinella sp. IMCC34191 TaxID=2259172 RepID=UPI0013007EB5|nr:hypothetical protein [Lewinella sp. IMCC34191]